MARYTSNIPPIEKSGEKSRLNETFNAGTGTEGVERRKSNVEMQQNSKTLEKLSRMIETSK